MRERIGQTTDVYALDQDGIGIEPDFIDVIAACDLPFGFAAAQRTPGFIYSNIVPVLGADEPDAPGTGHDHALTSGFVENDLAGAEVHFRSNLSLSASVAHLTNPKCPLGLRATTETLVSPLRLRS